MKSYKIEYSDQLVNTIPESNSKSGLFTRLWHWIMQSIRFCLKRRPFNIFTYPPITRMAMFKVKPTHDTFDDDYGILRPWKNCTHIRTGFQSYFNEDSFHYDDPFED